MIQAPHPAIDGLRQIALGGLKTRPRKGLQSCSLNLWIWIRQDDPRQGEHGQSGVYTLTGRAARPLAADRVILADEIPEPTLY